MAFDLARLCDSDARLSELDRDGAAARLPDDPSSIVHARAPDAYWGMIAATNGREDLSAYLACLNNGVDGFNAELYLQCMPPSAVIASEFVSGVKWPSDKTFGHAIDAREQLAARGPACLAQFRDAVEKDPAPEAAWAAFAATVADFEPGHAWPELSRAQKSRKRAGCSAADLVADLEREVSAVEADMRRGGGTRKRARQSE